MISLVNVEISCHDISQGSTMTGDRAVYNALGLSLIMVTQDQSTQPQHPRRGVVATLFYL